MTLWQRFVEATADTAFALGILFAGIAVTASFALALIFVVSQVVGAFTG